MSTDDPVDWMAAVVELLHRLDRIHDQLQRIADALEETLAPPSG